MNNQSNVNRNSNLVHLMLKASGWTLEELAKEIHKYKAQRVTELEIRAALRGIQYDNNELDWCVAYALTENMGAPEYLVKMSMAPTSKLVLSVEKSDELALMLWKTWFESYKAEQAKKTLAPDEKKS